MGKAARALHRRGRLGAVAVVTSDVGRGAVGRPARPFPDWRDEVRRLETEMGTARAREREVITGALRGGCSYSEVARILGTTRQAVHHRYRVGSGGGRPPSDGLPVPAAPIDPPGAN